MKNILIILFGVFLFSCSSDEGIGVDTDSGSDFEVDTVGFRVVSEAIVDGELLADFKCEEKSNDIESSIPLEWFEVPEGTGSLAVTMIHYPNTEDLTNPNSYILLWGIDPSVTEIPYGTADDGSWYMGQNKDGTAISYTSPCSPSAATHEYTITVYALSETPATLPTTSSIDVDYSTLIDAIGTVTTIETTKLTFNDVTE